MEAEERAYVEREIARHRATVARLRGLRGDSDARAELDEAWSPLLPHQLPPIVFFTPSYADEQLA